MAEDRKVAVTDDEFDNENDNLKQAPVFNNAALNDLMHRLVDTACENSEASRAAVAITFLTYFSSLVGNRICFQVGDHDLYARLFSLIVGNTSRGRKGTSMQLVHKIFERVNVLLERNGLKSLGLEPYKGGISTPEGIIYHIRDDGVDADDKVIIGVAEKRLFIIETEFVNVFVKCQQYGSTMSGFLRNAYDGSPLAPLIKTNRTSVRRPHITMLGHITNQELLSKIKGTTEASNGSLNRFTIFHASRDKIIARPKPTSQKEIFAFAEEITEILEYVYNNSTPSSILLDFDAEAEAFWCEIYKEFKSDSSVVGALTSRHEAQTLVFAMLLAVMDKSVLIKYKHLAKAVEWITYAEESIKYIFMTKDVAKQTNKEDAVKLKIIEILGSLTDGQTMKTSQIRNSLTGNVRSMCSDILQSMLDNSPPLIEVFRDKTKGRSSDNYRLAAHE